MEDTDYFSASDNSIYTLYETDDSEIVQINCNHKNNFQKFSFKECLTQIKNILTIVESQKLKNFDTTSQHNNVVSEILKDYFSTETSADLYDGFLRLFVELYDWVLLTFNSANEAICLATQIIQQFYEFIINMEKDKFKLLLQSPETINYVS